MSGYHGVGERRSLPSQYHFRNNAVNGRRFEKSFNMTTDQQFRAHNIDNVGERLRTESLYNNPWYWQNIGSLDTELMTGGSGLAVNMSQADGDYYNPYFYNQWKTTSGQRHSGAMSGEIGRRTVPRRDAEVGAGPALLPGSNEPTESEPSDVGMLAADRTTLSADRIGTTLRSDIDNTWSGRLDREMGHGMRADRQPIRYLASGLRGLAVAPARAGVFDMGLSSYDLARMRDDQLTGRPVTSVGAAWDTSFKNLSVRSTPLDTRRTPEGGMLPATPSLDATHQAMADRYASLHPASMTLDERLAALDADYRRLRGELVAGRPLPATPEPLVPAGPAELKTPDETSERPPDDPGGVASEQSDVEPTPIIDRLPTMEWKDYGLLLRHGQRVEALATGDGSRFDDLLMAGSQKLAAEDYFWAERRFNRALRFIPGHPLATAGLGHSQLGAGLYLSSALTLQTLLGFQPEMIDVRYDPALLPSQADLDRAVSTMADRLRGDRDLDRYGFLLAYIGHQIDRQDLVREGLDAMLRGGADKELTALLEEIWGPPIQDVGSE